MKCILSILERQATNFHKYPRSKLCTFIKKAPHDSPSGLEAEKHKQFNVFYYGTTVVFGMECLRPVHNDMASRANLCCNCDQQERRQTRFTLVFRSHCRAFSVKRELNGAIGISRVLLLGLKAFQLKTNQCSNYDTNMTRD